MLKIYQINLKVKKCVEIDTLIRVRFVLLPVDSTFYSENRLS